MTTIGPFSVPLPLIAAIIALFGLIHYKVDSIVYWITAGLAILYSSYKALEKERDKVIALEKIIDDREARQKAIDELWELRSWGIEHRNEHIYLKTGKDRYPQWHQEYLDWRNKVLVAANKVSINLMRWLESLDTVREAPYLPNAFNGEHQIDRTIMSEILARLQSFLEKEFLDVTR